VHTTIDLNGPVPLAKSILRRITSFLDNSKYIVQAPWRDILHFSRYDDYDRWTARNKVYTVDLAEQKLVEIDNLRDYVLFVGFNTLGPFFQNEILSSPLQLFGATWSAPSI
jgi:hypothetical protein